MFYRQWLVARDKCGYLPIHIASQFGSVKAFQLLWNFRRDSDSNSNRFCSVALVAARNVDGELRSLIFNTLLSPHSSLPLLALWSFWIFCAFDRNLLDLAVGNGHREIVKTIVTSERNWLFCARVRDCERIITLAANNEQWGVILVMFEVWKKQHRLKKSLSARIWTELKETLSHSTEEKSSRKDQLMRIVSDMVLWHALWFENLLPWKNSRRAFIIISTPFCQLHFDRVFFLVIFFIRVWIEKNTENTADTELQMHCHYYVSNTAANNISRLDISIFPPKLVWHTKTLPNRDNNDRFQWLLGD